MHETIRSHSLIGAWLSALAVLLESREGLQPDLGVRWGMRVPPITGGRGAGMISYRKQPTVHISSYYEPGLMLSTHNSIISSNPLSKEVHTIIIFVVYLLPVTPSPTRI